MEENRRQTMTKSEKFAAASHSVSIEKRKRASISGVVDVESFHETEVVLKTDAGIMVIEGERLHIGRLNLEEGRLDVEGVIDSVAYETQQKTTRRIGWFQKR